MQKPNKNLYYQLKSEQKCWPGRTLAVSPEQNF